MPESFNFTDNLLKTHDEPSPFHTEMQPVAPAAENMNALETAETGDEKGPLLSLDNLHSFAAMSSPLVFGAVRNEQLLKPFLASSPGRDALLMQPGAVSALKSDIFSNISLLAGTSAANLYIDRNYFKDVPVSWTSLAVDTAAPAVILTRAPWQVKAGLIVGSHLLTRYWDLQSQKTE